MFKVPFELIRSGKFLVSTHTPYFIPFHASLFISMVTPHFIFVSQGSFICFQGLKSHLPGAHSPLALWWDSQSHYSLSLTGAKLLKILHGIPTSEKISQLETNAEPLKAAFLPQALCQLKAFWFQAWPNMTKVPSFHGLYILYIHTFHAGQSPSCHR